MGSVAASPTVCEAFIFCPDETGGLEAASDGPQEHRFASLVSKPYRAPHRRAICGANALRKMPPAS
jgi:hypothetical protein